MRRADRLIELVGRLRAGALTRAEDLAAALEVSIRTVYRDIAALQAQGLPIEGQAGVGYLLRGPVDLPPFTFDHDQLEALALGLAYAEQVGDAELAAAARAARGKIDRVWSGQRTPDVSSRAIRSSQKPERRAPVIGAALRRALRERRLLAFAYADRASERTDRQVSPLALMASSETWLLIGYCLLRADFRVFRLDRIAGLQLLPQTFEGEPGRDLAAYMKSRRPDPEIPSARIVDGPWRDRR